jgi:hypothetical protein
MKGSQERFLWIAVMRMWMCPPFGTLSTKPWATGPVRRSSDDDGKSFLDQIIRHGLSVLPFLRTLGYADIDLPTALNRRIFGVPGTFSRR